MCGEDWPQNLIKLTESFFVELHCIVWAKKLGICASKTPLFCQKLSNLKIYRFGPLMHAKCVNTHVRDEIVYFY